MNDNTLPRAKQDRLSANGPGQGQAVIGTGAAPHFVQDHQGPVRGIINDVGGFGHLDHEGGLTAYQFIGPAPGD